MEQDVGKASIRNSTKPCLVTEKDLRIMLVISEFVERFPELSLFYRLFSPLDSEMICIFPYFCPYAESAREIREIFS